MFVIRLFCQTTDQIGQMKFVKCKIIETEKAIDTISGQPFKVLRLIITAKTSLQLISDSWENHPDTTINNKLTVSYAYDSTGVIYDSIISEIKKYVLEKEKWAKEYNTGNDFTYFTFNKSFFLKDTILIPFVRSEGESPGSYAIYYINKHVYKIKLLPEPNALSNLSLFISQNMYFTLNNKYLDLGDYIKNLDKVKEILKEKN